VSPIQEGVYLGEPTRIVYAVFTTPENAIGGNAICAFQIKDILHAFQGNITPRFQSTYI
jgi:semaphorin 6